MLGSIENGHEAWCLVKGGLEKFRHRAESQVFMRDRFGSFQDSRALRKRFIRRIVFIMVKVGHIHGVLQDKLNTPRWIQYRRMCRAPKPLDKFSVSLYRVWDQRKVICPAGRKHASK